MGRSLLRIGATIAIVGVLLSGSSPQSHTLLMAQQGSTDAQLRYADELLQNGDRATAIYWLKLASLQQDPAAAIALSELVPTQSRLWLERAAAFGSRTARQQLVVEATRRYDYATAHRWLSSSTNLTATEEAMAWQWELAYAPIQKLSSLLEKAPQQGATQGVATGLRWALQNKSNDDGGCETLVIALPNGHERLQVLRLLNDFQKHPVGRLPWCPSLTSPTNTTANIHFVTTQRAFNAAGVIHLPTDSSVALLAHELAHTAGLADEYPMRAKLAKDFCAGKYDHPANNVVVSASQSMSSKELKALWQSLPWRQEIEHWHLLGEQQSDGLWRLGSDDGLSVGLFAARTCEQSSGYAWKPVATTSAMEVYELNKWPTLYLNLMRAELEY